MADKKFIDLPVAGALNGTEVVPVDQGGATVQTTIQAVANLAPIQNHNALTNLTAGDAHPQYLNQARGDARYPQLTRTIASGNGLNGGGDLSANRTLTVVGNAARGITVTVNGVELDLLSLGLLPESVDATNDRVPIYNASESRPRLVSPATLLAGASGFVPTARVIGDGAGLTGGGDLSADRTLAVGAGTGITVNANDVQLDLAHARNVDHSAVSINTGTGLTGGGSISASRTVALDTANTRNIDHAAVAINAGTGLTGGGDLTANRTIAVDTTAIPTLAGRNIFTQLASGNGGLEFNSLIPGYWFVETDVAANQTTWGTRVNGGQWRIELLTDDRVTVTPVFSITRSNNVATFIDFTANSVRINNVSIRDAAILNVGTLTDTVVKQSNVTQHQAALNIAWSQITGTKNADQLGGIASSGYVQTNSSPQLAALGVGTAAGSAGSIRATGDITAFFSSDIKWKTNVRTIETALTKIDRIRGVRFDWTQEFLDSHGPGSGYFYGKRDVGVIAQEVREVIPEVVREREDGSLAVAYEKLVPLLIQGIKELMAEVEMLKAKLS